MTNADHFRHDRSLNVSRDTTSSIAAHVTASRSTQRLLTSLASMLVIVLTSSFAFAQDEFTYGRQPIGSTPSGSASGTVVDSNRQGVGFTFRGGHVAGGTVGRNDSASIIGLSPYVNIGDGLLFGDSRLTYTNDGGLAWSFGGGYRQYVTAWDAVIGGYGYFDRDEITGGSFDQFSVGAEILTQNWEARGNYYSPSGNTSTQTGTRIDTDSASFSGNQVLFNRINTFAEALEGYDAEIGWLLPGDFSERFDVRAFGGGYHYKGDGLAGFSGFSARLQADIANWLELGLKITDDEVFNTNVSFNAIVHFGEFNSQEHTRRSAIQRLAEPVRRNLNIVTAVSDVVVGGEVGLGAGGAPLNIVHVNSNAGPGGAGTVENPFDSLLTGLAAPSDVVFVHAGSQFDAVPENQITLSDNQSLFGEGLITDASGNRVVINEVELLGGENLVLPESPTFAANMTLTRPELSNTVGDAVVLANNSRFGGFVIDNVTGNGIVADTREDIVIRDTQISNVTGDGILLTNSINTASVINTRITNAAGAAFHVNGGGADIGFTSTSVGIDPAFGAIDNIAGEAVLIENTTGGSVNMSSSTIDDLGGAGIIIRDSLGDAVIDNANIVNAIGNGISVTNSAGQYTFRDTIRDSTRIENATGASVFIDGLATTGRVSFENLDIVTPQGGGIDINNLAGQFNFTQDLTIGAAAAGSTSPFISVDGSLDGASVTFSGDINIFGGAAPALSGGTGIELINNAAGSSFAATGLTTITSIGGPGVSVLNDASSISFGSMTTGGLTVQENAGSGIAIDNASGTITFQNATNVIQNLNAGDPLVNIQNSSAFVSFDSLQVLANTTNIGVNLVDNVRTVDGQGQIIFDTLGIVTTGGTSLFGNNNTLISTRTGTITSTGSAAVDIEESGIDITLEQVNSTASPTFGIRLVETNKDLTNHPVLGKTFTVEGDALINPTALSGGQILAAVGDGVTLANAGQVTLQAMEIRDNQNGIVVLNSGIVEEDDQFLRLFNSSIFESEIRGIDSTNLTELDVQDSLFGDNGNLAPAAGADATRNTILATFTEVPNDPDTEEFLDYETPYTINLERNQFTDNSDDVITVLNTATAIGAHLGLNADQNQFFLNDTNDFDAADLNESGFEITWNGPARIQLESNQFTLSGQTVGESQTAIFLDLESSTDLLELEVVGNQIGNTVQPGAFGIDLMTAGPSTSLFQGNEFIFQGLESQGMRFTLGADTRLDLIGNAIAFENEGGLGIEVVRLTQTATFQISGNLIQLSDTLTAGAFPLPNDPPLEEGIVFRSASGAYTIFGAQNNIIELITPGDIDTVAFFAGNVNGAIIVNGVAGP
ncbi:MAG: inverse autotransporter beta domain-containing protein [Fuerstiella sp.]